MKKLAATDAQEKLAVADAKLGQVIKKKFEIDCVFDSNVQELMRYVLLYNYFEYRKHFRLYVLCT